MRLFITTIFQFRFDCFYRWIQTNTPRPWRPAWRAVDVTAENGSPAGATRGRGRGRGGATPPVTASRGGSRDDAGRHLPSLLRSSSTSSTSATTADVIGYNCLHYFSLFLFIQSKSRTLSTICITSNSVWRISRNTCDTQKTIILNWTNLSQCYFPSHSIVPDWLAMPSLCVI